MFQTSVLDAAEDVCVRVFCAVCWQGYPRLLIENRVYSSRVFRKLHLELAVRQDGLQFLHLVFYPRLVLLLAAAPCLDTLCLLACLLAGC